MLSIVEAAIRGNFAGELAGADRAQFEQLAGVEQHRHPLGATLARGLDPIPLQRASGRLRYHDEGGLTEASGRQLSLETSDGLNLAPTHFFLSLRDKTGTSPAKGEFVANRLDLNVLSRLASRLPFDPAFHARLADLAPQGSVAPVNLKWSNDAGRLLSYSVDARFAGLGIEPVGAWPGFSGLSGRVDGNERGGRFNLTGRDAALELPQIFPQPRLALAEISAEGSWSHPDGRLEVRCRQARGGLWPRDPSVFQLIS